MGHPSHAESRPLRQVTVPTFWMTRHEVTVDQYSWIESVDSERIPSHEMCVTTFRQSVEQPMNCVSYDDAGFRGEWAYAPKMPRTLSWGNDAGATGPMGGLRCAQPKPVVCSIPDGENDWGICDLMGNLSEWTADDQDELEDAPTDGSVWLAPSDLGTRLWNDRQIEAVRVGFTAVQQH